LPVNVPGPDPCGGGVGGVGRPIRTLQLQDPVAAQADIPKPQPQKTAFGSLREQQGETTGHPLADNKANF